MKLAQRQESRDLFDATDHFKATLERFLECHEASLMLTVSTAYKALKRAQSAEGLPGAARTEIRSATRMCAAALGIEGE